MTYTSITKEQVLDAITTAQIGVSAGDLRTILKAQSNTQYSKLRLALRQLRESVQIVMVFVKRNKTNVAVYVVNKPQRPFGEFDVVLSSFQHIAARRISEGSYANR